MLESEKEILRNFPSIVLSDFGGAIWKEKEDEILLNIRDFETEVTQISSDFGPSCNG